MSGWWPALVGLLVVLSVLVRGCPGPRGGGAAARARRPASEVEQAASGGDPWVRARDSRPGPRTPASRTDVATAADLLALALAGGAPLEDAMLAVAQHCPAPVSLQLRTVATAWRWGVAEATAWELVPAAWAPVRQALLLARLAGVPPAGLLRRAAADIRTAEEQRVVEAGEALGVRAVVPLTGCFLPAFVIVAVVPLVASLAGTMLSGW